MSDPRRPSRRRPYPFLAGRARLASESPCPRCRELTIAGPDADIAATPARCDPWPLTPLAEAIALSVGLRTFTLRRAVEGDHAGLVLDYRDAWRMRAAGPRPTVLAEHRCPR